MKMIFTILANERTDQVASDLLAEKFRVTKLASTAGFLSAGTTTLMVGVRDEDLVSALDIIRGHFSLHPKDDDVKATIYVLNVKDFKQFN